MNLNSGLAFAAAIFSAIVGLVALWRRRSIVRWCFCAGMLFFSVESTMAGFSFASTEPQEIAVWQTFAFLAKCFLPGTWFCFSLTYSRGNYREFLVRSRWLLVAAFLIPLGWIATIFSGPLASTAQYQAPGEGWMFGPGTVAKLLNVLILVFTVLILTNLERTFRSAVGTMRWRIKFLVLGLGVIFGSQIYTGSQSLLFSGHSLSELTIKNVALLIGCGLIAAGYLRSGFGEIDLYPSRAVLHTSVTILLAGTYLFIVGMLATVVARFGGAAAFPITAFLALLGLAGLAMLLLSERLRQSVQLFVSLHFRRPQHDFRQVWARFTAAFSAILDERTLSTTAARMVSETFGALSVSVWLVDEHRQRLVQTGSTAASERMKHDCVMIADVKEIGPIDFAELMRPLDLTSANEPWAKMFTDLSGRRFRTGGDPIFVPLVAAERCLGVLLLADRVRGIRYTGEEMELLKCIGDQIAANLLNLRLSEQILQQKEVEAFQTVSTFFVHDLKNAASTLGLMLQNLPVHFDDPAFREDALGGIGAVSARINQLISRMNALRHELRLERTELNVSDLLRETLAQLNGTISASVLMREHPVPSIVGDRHQLISVLTNLILNASDALGENGRIIIETTRQKDSVSISVSDNGCGMTEEFMRNSLFRPFRTTKKKGIGIGMFQAKMIIEAHNGTIHATSNPGEGTTFRLLLPIKT